MLRRLHKFTNLNKPVDFAGRMVYNEKEIKEVLILANTKAKVLKTCLELNLVITRG